MWDFLKGMWETVQKFFVTLFMMFVMLFTAPGDIFSADVGVEFTAPADALCDTCAYDITVAEYNVYYATISFDSTDFKTIATMQNFCPTPNTPGTRETCTLTGLNSGATYFIGVTSVDSAGNESSLSNVVTYTTPDTTPPQRINDLMISVGG